MSLLSTLPFVSQYVASGAPDVPPEVQQVAIQLSNQTCELLTRLISRILPWAVLSAALALLTGRLLLVRPARVQNAILSGSRLSLEAGTRRAAHWHRRPKYALESRIARANRQALQRASTRIKAGQLSN